MVVSMMGPDMPERDSALDRPLMMTSASSSTSRGTEVASVTQMRLRVQGEAVLCPMFLVVNSPLRMCMGCDSMGLGDTMEESVGTVTESLSMSWRGMLAMFEPSSAFHVRPTLTGGESCANLGLTTSKPNMYDWPASRSLVIQKVRVSARVDDCCSQSIVWHTQFQHAAAKGCEPESLTGPGPVLTEAPLRPETEMMTLSPPLARNSTLDWRVTDSMLVSPG
mmetsp:Transcript_6057/g.14593  ORF Transcript_6057/g.14593 Transcript_6057/m.14593 type:complete len:222 (+) Transcript_6057:9079-9744(+)